MNPVTAAAIVVVMFLSVVHAHAHTLAGTMVSVALGDRDTVIVTIAAEADPLIAKLEALAGVDHREAETQAERRTRLESLFPILRAHIDARVDGHPLDLSLEDAPVDDTAQVEMRLTATLPAPSAALRSGRSRLFTWRCTFIFGAYQVTTMGSDGADAVEWLQGPQASTPIALEPLADLSASRSSRIRVGHSLAMGALVMWVLHRRRRSYFAAGG